MPNESPLTRTAIYLIARKQTVEIEYTVVGSIHPPVETLARVFPDQPGQFRVIAGYWFSDPEDAKAGLDLIKRHLRKHTRDSDGFYAISLDEMHRALVDAFHAWGEGY